MVNDGALVKKDNLEFRDLAQQVSIDRAVAEKSYATTMARFPQIELLYQRIFDAKGIKETTEVAAMIQAQMLMAQNEANNMATVNQLSRTQQAMQMVTARDTAVQRKVQGLIGGW